jgi:ATP-binding cassette subfamily C protein
MLGAILIYNPYLFLFTFVTVFPTAALLIYINRKKLSKKGLRLHTIMPLVYENITELTNGISNIKLWNGSDYFYNRYSKFKKESYALKEKIYVNSQFVPIRIYEVIAITGILCVVLFGILGDQSISSIISYISIYAGVSFRLLPSVNRIITSSNSLSTNDYMLSYLENNIVEKPIVKKSLPLHFTDNIALDQVSFGYSPNMNVFQDVSIKINKGQFIGIVGLSGSGKSTLVNTIASLIEPTSGNLKLDGKMIDKGNCGAYRFLFSYVKQDVFMLNASIVKNIAFLDEEPDIEKVKECIAKVNLEEWVGTLTQGIDTNVGEVGGQISGGQRQRIAIARALYKDANIFIFDEVTNNLDSYSREQTLKAISLLKDAGKTAIFITHKEDELKLCDRVYSLENKKLVSI